MRTQTFTLKRRRRPVAGKMNGNLTTFGKRLAKLEDEVAVLRREWAQSFPLDGAKKLDQPKPDVWAGFWADQKQLEQGVDRFFKELGIKGEPIPAEELQKMMGELDLEPNEISQAITAARDE